MSEINLSAAVRTSLTELQSTADLLSTTQERLATGNRVNSALDDPSAFFTATALNDRAADLSTLLDAQGQAIQVVEAADQGITAISDLVDSARAIANQALQTDDADARSQFASQFDDILGQIETLAADASFNGINLLDSENSTDLTVVFNEDNTASLTVEGVNFTDTSAGLGLDRVSSINNAAGAGGAVASATQVNVSDFAAGESVDITVGNSNGTDTTFSVTFEDTDAVAQQDAQSVVTADQFNLTDSFDIGAATGITFTDTDNSAVDAALTLNEADLSAASSIDIAVDGAAPTTVNLVDADVADGTLTLTDGTTANQIDLTNAAAGDEIQFTGGNGVSFNVTLDAASAGGDFTALAALIDTEAATAGADISTAGTTATTLELSSSVGNVAFDSTPATTGGTFAGTATTETSSNFNAGDGIQADEIETAITAAGISGITATDNLDGTVGLVSTGGDITVTDGAAVNLDSAVDGTAFDNGLDTSEIIDQINAQTGTSGVSATPDANDPNNIVLSSTTADFSVTNTTASSTVTDTSVASATTQSFAAASGAGLSTQEIQDQINAAASAAGVDTSSGAFNVGTATTGIPPVEVITFASDTGDISLAGTGGSTISADSADSAIATNSAFSAGNGGGSDFADVDAINQTLSAIDDALTTLRSTASTLGSDLSTIQIRSDFTENLINTLEVGAGNLTLADLNEEGANLLTLQTRQTLASTSLSFATQADQSVLSLF